MCPFSIIQVTQRQQGEGCMGPVMSQEACLVRFVSTIRAGACSGSLGATHKSLSRAVLYILEKKISTFSCFLYLETQNYFIFFKNT